ncbi:hypothetical protein E4U23_005261 [Claviceps purpurea]|nr:hypothetical protein E4U23_005261 [Claviceps purpurea]
MQAFPPRQQQQQQQQQYITAAPSQAMITAPTQQSLPMPPESSGDHQVMFTDRRYGRANSPRYTYAGKGKPPRKQCLVCGRQGCWSTNHSRDEQKKAKDKWWKDKPYEGVPTSTEISDDEDEYEIEMAIPDITQAYTSAPKVVLRRQSG